MGAVLVVDQALGREAAVNGSGGVTSGTHPAGGHGERAEQVGAAPGRREPREGRGRPPPAVIAVFSLPRGEARVQPDDDRGDAR